jgi:hypothetical protein
MKLYRSPIERFGREPRTIQPAKVGAGDTALLEEGQP